MKRADSNDDDKDKARAFHLACMHRRIEALEESLTEVDIDRMAFSDLDVRFSQ